MVLGLGVQLCPPLNVFWNYFFNNDWKGEYNLSIADLQVTMYMITSLLIALCFLAGRLGIV